MDIDSQVQAGRILTGTESISLKVKASNARHIYGKVNGLRRRRISIHQEGGEKKPQVVRYLWTGSQNHEFKADDFKVFYSCFKMEKRLLSDKLHQSITARITPSK